MTMEIDHAESHDEKVGKGKRLSRSKYQQTTFGKADWNIIDELIRTNVSINIAEYIFPQGTIFGSVLKAQIKGIINYDGAY